MWLQLAEFPGKAIKRAVGHIIIGEKISQRKLYVRIGSLALHRAAAGAGVILHRLLAFEGPAAAIPPTIAFRTGKRMMGHSCALLVRPITQPATGITADHALGVSQLARR